jgi:hypothetical protein
VLYERQMARRTGGLLAALDVSVTDKSEAVDAFHRGFLSQSSQDVALRSVNYKCVAGRFVKRLP